jgi:predicted dehydrogenase
MGCRVTLVTRSTDVPFPRFSTIAEALVAAGPDYVVIANDTRLHGETLGVLAQCGFSGTSLVEKPMLARHDEACALPVGPLFVGYTLRFHPLISRLFSLLADEPLWTFTAYVGQYLPDWRPDQDYRQSYSARRDDGGVLRDLSHELDYAQMLAGRWRSTVAAGGHTSDLQIDSEDSVTVLAECERCPMVTLHMNYLDRSVSRWIIVNGAFGTYRVDLVKGLFVHNGSKEKVCIDRDAMIRDQHAAAFAATDPRLCTHAAAMSTLCWIDAAHVAMAERRWITA